MWTAYIVDDDGMNFRNSNQQAFPQDRYLESRRKIRMQSPRPRDLENDLASLQDLANETSRRWLFGPTSLLRASR